MVLWLMVLNATFNNISVISWRSVLLVEETGENHRLVASNLHKKEIESLKPTTIKVLEVISYFLL